MQHLAKVVVLSLCIMCGCSGKVTPRVNPAPIEVSGTVTIAGKPVNDVVINFQPTGPGSLPALLTVKDGKFQGHANPGRYTYFVTPGQSKEAFKSVPEKYRAGAMDRQFSVAPENAIDFKLD